MGRKKKGFFDKVTDGDYNEKLTKTGEAVGLAAGIAAGLAALVSAFVGISNTVKKK